MAQVSSFIFIITYVLTRIPICICRHNCSGHSKQSEAEERTKYVLEICEMSGFKLAVIHLNLNSYLRCSKFCMRKTAKFAFL